MSPCGKGICLSFVQILNLHMRAMNFQSEFYGPSCTAAVVGKFPVQQFRDRLAYGAVSLDMFCFAIIIVTKQSGYINRMPCLVINLVFPVRPHNALQRLPPSKKSIPPCFARFLGQPHSPLSSRLSSGLLFCFAVCRHPCFPLRRARFLFGLQLGLVAFHMEPPRAVTHPFSLAAFALFPTLCPVKKIVRP